VSPANHWQSTALGSQPLIDWAAELEEIPSFKNALPFRSERKGIAVYGRLLAETTYCLS